MINKKKISIFSSSLNVGGAERFSINLAKGFINLGHHVDLIIVNKKNHNLEVDKRVNIINLNSYKARNVLFKLSKYIYLNRPDVFISTQDYLNFISFLCSLYFRKPKYYFREANNPKKNRSVKNFFLNYFFYYLIKLNYKYGDFIIAPSLGIKKQLIDYYKIKRKIFVINNSIDEIFILNNSNKFNIKYEKYFKIPCIINIGRLEKQKNHELLIDAFKNIISFKKCNLLIIGDGSQKYKLQQKIKDENLEDRVTILSNISNPYPFLAKSELFVLSSNYEGFPNTLLEALFLEIKVVSTNCESGPNEILEDGKNGILVESNNIKELTNAIKLSLEQIQDKNIKKKISKKYGINNIATQYLQLLK